MEGKGGRRLQIFVRWDPKKNDGTPLKDKDGKFVASDERVVVAKIGLKYDRDGEVDKGGFAYPTYRPSSFYYVFAMCKDNKDQKYVRLIW